MDEGADLLGRAVVGVVVAGRQGIRTQDDATLGLGTESGATGGTHDLLGGVLAVIIDAQAVAHGVVAGQVAGDLSGLDEVVGRQGQVEVGAGDLDDLGSRTRQDLDGLVEACLDLRVVPLTGEFGDDTDPHSGDIRLVRSLDDDRGGLVDGRLVHQVMTADHLVQQGRIQDGTSAGSGGVQGRRHRDDAVPGRRPVGRLDADGAGHRTGLTNGPSGVGTESQRGLESSQAGGRSAARATRNSVEVPRVVGGAEGRGLGRGSHGELVQVRLAQDHHAGVLASGDDGRVIGRDPSLQHPGRGRGGQSLGAEEILHGQRHTGQRTELLTVGDPRVNPSGSFQGTVVINQKEGTHVAVDLADPVQVCLGDLLAGDLAGRNACAEFGGGQGHELVHCASSSRMRGTRKR